LRQDPEGEHHHHPQCREKLQSHNITFLFICLVPTALDLRLLEQCREKYLDVSGRNTKMGKIT
jgi:hypothetical protein